MPVSQIGTNALSMGLNITPTNISYSGTLTGGTGIVNLGSGQFYKDAPGNVGIGTSSPVASSLLTLKKTNAGGDGAELRLINSSTTVETATQIVFTNTTTDSANSAVIKVARTAAGQDFRFSSDGTERMRIDSSGNLLVGKTTTATTSLGWSLASDRGNAKFSAGNYMIFNRDDNDILINFRRSDTSVGTITVNTTNTTYGTSSDYRLKEDVQPMVGALAKVAALKPCTYKWKVDGSEGEGFIAHELAAVVPQAVVGEKDAVNEDGSIKPQGIDTSFLVATLTAAIQELKAELDTVKAELAALKGA